MKVVGKTSCSIAFSSEPGVATPSNLYVELPQVLSQYSVPLFARGVVVRLGPTVAVVAYQRQCGIMQTSRESVCTTLLYAPPLLTSGTTQKLGVRVALAIAL